MSLNLKVQKKHVPYLVGVGVLLILALTLQTSRLIRAQGKARYFEGVVQAQVLTLKMAHEATNKAISAQREADKRASELKAEAEKRIAALQKAAEAEHAAHQATLAKLKTLSDDALASKIGERIGAPEIKAIASGGFLLSRPGGERTASIFADETLAQADIKRCGEEKALIIDRLNASMDQVAARDETIRAKDGEISVHVDREAALQSQVKALRLAGTGKFWKGAGIGAAVGALIVLIAGK